MNKTLTESHFVGRPVDHEFRGVRYVAVDTWFAQRIACIDAAAHARDDNCRSFSCIIEWRRGVIGRSELIIPGVFLF